MDNTLRHGLLGQRGERRRGQGRQPQRAPLHGARPRVGRGESGRTTTTGAGSRTYNHYSWGWAWAGNTPHKLWKRYTWLGGTRTPLIVHWPGRVAQPGTVRPQFSHAVDLLPTILGRPGIEVPDAVDGVPQQQVDGASLLPALDDPAPPRSTTRSTSR